MIIDTSALVAVLNDEPGSDALLEALVGGHGVIPAPVLVEYERVTALQDNRPDPNARALVEKLLAFGNAVAAFDAAAGQAARDANQRYGRGNGHGARLNMLDLMVYGAAREAGLPILCTGKDFTRTDALIHPASRRDP